jgi:hypothetical protein
MSMEATEKDVVLGRGDIHDQVSLKLDPSGGAQGLAILVMRDAQSVSDFPARTMPAVGEIRLGQGAVEEANLGPSAEGAVDPRPSLAGSADARPAAIERILRRRAPRSIQQRFSKKIQGRGASFPCGADEPLFGNKLPVLIPALRIPAARESHRGDQLDRRGSALKVL